MTKGIHGRWNGGCYTVGNCTVGEITYENKDIGYKGLFHPTYTSETFTQRANAQTWIELQHFRWIVKSYKAAQAERNRLIVYYRDTLGFNFDKIAEIVGITTSSTHKIYHVMKGKIQCSPFTTLLTVDTSLNSI